MPIKPSSKSKKNIPVIKSARGKYCWDIDGKKYIDFTGSSLTNILGYRPTLPSVPNYPGISDIELDLSKLLRSYTATKYFRYFKNGHNAVDCAVRLARHILNGSPINVCYYGYHGTSDSYVWTTDNYSGVAEQYDIGGYNQSYQINDINESNNIRGGIDILVFESRYAEYADKIEAKIKIQDHLKSGIRGLYESSYDFDLFGKSIANGSPLAVMTGKDDLMEKIDEIYYSTTFGSNPGDMRECIRTIKEFEKGKDKYFKLYNYALDKLPKWQTISDYHINCFKKEGILYNGYYQIMTVHSKKDIDRLAELCNNLNIK